MKLDSIKHFLIDIDGTITYYKTNSITQDALLAGNFLFPIIRDMLVENGWDPAEAAAAIKAEADRIIFWDYIDFIEKFDLSREEAFFRIRKWHRDNLLYYEDMVETIKVLAARNKNLFIISNNPYWGCRFKLEIAGLAPEHFQKIFGTNIVNGCKHLSEVWNRAINQVAADPGNIATIGDNPKEDGEIPQNCGIGYSFILERKSETALLRKNRSIYLNDARQILTYNI